MTDKASGDDIEIAWETEDYYTYVATPADGYVAMAFLRANPEKNFPAFRWAVFYPGCDNPTDCIGVGDDEKDMFASAERALIEKMVE